MQITLEADYAVRIVDLLAACGQLTDASAIAEQTGVPQRFALKILRKLAEKEIVLSIRGAKGGYKLSRPPEQISLRQVMEAVEGPFVISRCQKEDYICDTAGCRFHKIYADITQMVRDRLEAVTFAESMTGEPLGEGPAVEKT
jgi:Rrf2 family protein